MSNAWKRSAIAVGISVLTLSSACVAPQRTSETGTAKQPDETSSEQQVLADQDAERAKAAIEREHALQSGERRPARPADRSRVDQPRVGGGIR